MEIRTLIILPVTAFFFEKNWLANIPPQKIRKITLMTIIYISGSIFRLKSPIIKANVAIN